LHQQHQASRIHRVASLLQSTARRKAQQHCKKATHKSSFQISTAGSHNVVATYSGDGNYSPSTSPALTQVVNSTFSKPVGYGIDVTTRGLKGDGVTDNTAALKALIANLPPDQFGRTGGERLYFPAGTYLISDYIDVSKLTGITIAGDVGPDGLPATTIKANSIATPYTLYVSGGADNVTAGPFYPMFIDEIYNGGGSAVLYFKNIALAAPTIKNGVA
jgi:hypothetical protein